MPESQSGVPASFWTNALRRQAFLIVMLMLVGAAGGAAYAVVKGASYTSSARIIIDPLEGNPYEPEGKSDQLVNLETEAALVATNPVAEIAARDLRGSKLTDEQLRKQLEVTVPPNTQVLLIEVTAPNRLDARDTAQAFANGYLAYRKERAKDLINAELARLRRQQDGVRTEIKQTNAELQSDTLSTSERNGLEERLSSLSARLSGLDTQVSNLQSTDLRPGQVISPASLPPIAGLTAIAMFTAGGGAVGILIGLLIAIARARADDRIHTPADIEHLGIAVLGIGTPRYGSGVPEGPEDSRHRYSRVPELPESYRALRTALVTTADDPPLCVAFLGASPSVDTAPETAGVAVGLARAGFRVAVVDTLGETAWLLGGRGRLRGLGELLVEDADLDRLLIQPEERLLVLPLGQAHTHTLDRLLSPQMHRSVTELVSMSDYVLLAGDIATGSDGRALASLAGAVVVVANRHVTTRARMTDSVAAVRRIEADLLGAVLVDAGPPQGPARRALRRTARFMGAGKQGKGKKRSRHTAYDEAPGGEYDRGYDGYPEGSYGETPYPENYPESTGEHVDSRS